MRHGRSGIFLVVLGVLLLGTAVLRAQGAPEIRSRLDAVRAEKYPDADAVIVLDQTHVNVEESGLSHVSKTQLIKVLTEKGAAEYATMRFDYDPASSFAEVKKLKIYRKNGKVETMPASRIFDLPQPQHMIYWGPRMKLASVSKLNPGDAVEIETYSKGFVIAYLHDPTKPGDEKYIPPMRGHYYDVVLFQGDLPIVKKIYTVVLPKDKPIRAGVYNGELGSETSFDDTSLTYTWWKENVPAVSREAKMLEDTDCLPKLVLATVKDWPEKSRWFYHVNEDKDTFAWNDAIKAKVDEIIKGLKTDDAKRKAILAWVARQIRYSGISMGKGEGYTLHPGIMDFNDRCGVCKDIAGMCITMFRAAGFAHTYPAMTMAGARVENLPADQFNHCVVATEVAPNEYKMYDPTWCPFSREVWSSAEKPQNYVIGSPRGEVLMETPPAPPSDNFIDIKAEERIDEKGDLEGRLTITGGHYSETNLRWALMFSPAYAERAVFEQWLSKISPRAELTDYSTTDPVDVNTPFEITLEYQASGYAMVSETQMVFTPPMARNILSSRRLTDFSAAVGSPTRHYGIFLRATREFNYKESITLPKGYTLAAAPKAGTVDQPAAGFSAEISSGTGSVLLKEQLMIKKKIIPASEYDGLKAAVDASEEFGHGFVVVSRSGGAQ